MVAALTGLGVTEARCGDPPNGQLSSAATQSGYQLAIELRDGSRIIGQPVGESLSFRSAALGDLKLPWAGILSIECPPTGAAHLTATNGDRISVELATDTLRVATGFGQAELPVGLIRGIDVSIVARPAGVAANGGAGSEGPIPDGLPPSIAIRDVDGSHIVAWGKGEWSLYLCAADHWKIVPLDSAAHAISATPDCYEVYAFSDGHLLYDVYGTFSRGAFVEQDGLGAGTAAGNDGDFALHGEGVSGGTYTPPPLPAPVLTPVPVPPDTDVGWFEGNVPPGACTGEGRGGSDWDWAAVAGMPVFESRVCAGFHGQFFSFAKPEVSIRKGDSLVAYIFLGPDNPPTEIMLHWSVPAEGVYQWNHRAYWGADQAPFSGNGDFGRHYMGPLPPAGKWVRLEVPARAVGLEGDSIDGEIFSLVGGGATWAHVATTHGFSAAAILEPMGKGDVQSRVVSADGTAPAR